MASPADAARFTYGIADSFFRGRELRLREGLARAGQHQQLREYEDRKAKELAAAGREQTFNRLAATYIGEPGRNDLQSQFRSRLSGPSNPLAMPGVSSGTTEQQPTNLLAAPSLAPSDPGMQSTGSTARPGMPTPANGASRLNWGNLNRDELMRDMIQADPKRAREIQTWGDEQWRNEALQTYRKAEQILSSTAPKMVAEQLAPDLIEGIVEDGQSWQNLTDDQVRNVARAVMSEMSPLAGINMDTPLETVMGPDGKPQLVPRSQAAGKQPYEKGSQPSSYEEFVLAQKDPEFSRFLKDRRGKGIRMTMPDGSVVEIGGNDGAVGSEDLTAPTRNRLQESLVQAADELDRLNSIGQDFDPRFLQIPGRLKAAGLKVKDLAGGLLGELNPEEQAYLSRFSSFKANAAKNLSAILNRLSGAAISPAEAVRLKKGIPNEDDSPTEFVAKYLASVKDTTRATMRANWALKNGIGVRSVDQLSQVMPLDAIDQVFEQRANQIWQELGGTPDVKQQAIQQAKQEFGLAR